MYSVLSAASVVRLVISIISALIDSDAVCACNRCNCNDNAHMLTAMLLLLPVLTLLDHKLINHKLLTAS
jgi:hypothetical protein